MPSRSGAAGNLRPRRPVFPRADWLWQPIPASPVLDSQSAAIVTALSAGGTSHIANLVDFGVTMRGPSGITTATSRYDVTFANVPAWGSDPFGSDTMPAPAGMSIPPGSDKHVSVGDPVRNKAYNLWQASTTGSAWSASWGAMCDLNGDGRETTGSSTGAGLARYAAVITAAEIAAGRIDHALFFSTNMARATEFRYPATKTDGLNSSGSSTTIPEGARVQLDPSINLAAISGITAAEITIGRALQTYGAYCGDNGDARMAFIFEYVPGTTAYSNAGLAWDYFDLTHIPWSSLRVLASWNGAGTPLSYRRGVNLAGPEYGCGNSVETNTGSGAFSYSAIGTYGNQFIYPSSSDIAYMATQLGTSPIFRFNVRMERLTTGPGQGFRTAEATRVTALLDAAAANGAGVILAPWNFGAVWNPTRAAIGSAGFSTAQFADFWSRVVTQWGSHSALIGADLMTEPVGVTGGASGWQTAAQAAVTAIRAVNTNLWIWVPTYDYQIHTVATDHPSGPWITDATGKFGYTQHQYAYNMGGSETDYTNCLNTAIGDGWTAGANTDALHTRELAGITAYKNWVGTHKVYIGEYGCPNPGNPLVSSTDAPKWLALWQRLLTEYDTNGWWATAWTSGSAVDVTDSNEQYVTYYATGGWGTTVNAKSGTATQTEAHPSQG